MHGKEILMVTVERHYFADLVFAPSLSKPALSSAEGGERRLLRLLHFLPVFPSLEPERKGDLHGRGTKAKTR